MMGFVSVELPKEPTCQMCFKKEATMYCCRCHTPICSNLKKPKPCMILDPKNSHSATCWECWRGNVAEIAKDKLSNEDPFRLTISHALGSVPMGETVIGLRVEDRGQPKQSFGSPHRGEWIHGVLDVYVDTYGPRRALDTGRFVMTRKTWTVVRGEGKAQLQLVSEVIV